MSQSPPNNPPDPAGKERFAAERRRLRRRYAKDRRFRIYTVTALAIAGAFLTFFLVDLVRRGAPAIRQAMILTEITYTPETVDIPRLAVPETVRDLVSRTRLRQIPREGKRAQLRLTIAPGAGSPENAAEALAGMSLPAEDFFGAMKEDAPYQIPQGHILRFVGEPGLEQIAEALRDRGAGEATELWVWGSDALDEFLTYGTGLDPPLARSADLLEKAGRTRPVFDALTFGPEGGVREEWVLAQHEVDQYLKGYEYIQPETYDDPRRRPISLEMAERIDRLLEEGRIRLAFNKGFFLNGDSKMPEAAGIFPAAVGSVLVLAIVFVLCVPIGVLTSIYLEEFAPDNALTQTIEVNINNLAAIPSILFGVLGLAVFINLPSSVGGPNLRSTALVGGATLALMTLPIIIISSRAALRAVPDSIRMAGHAMGATRWQVVLHHVLPQSISGILTGSIIGLAQAMGETAPLIIVGLVAFVPEAPSGVTEPTTVMPAQIFTWFGEPQPAFQERAALGIVMLLLVLFIMNGLAVYLRARSEKRW